MKIIDTRVELAHSEPELSNNSIINLWFSELFVVANGESNWFGDVCNSDLAELQSFLAHFDAIPSMAKAIDAYVRFGEAKVLNSKDHAKKLSELQELMRIAHEKMHV